MKRTNYLLKLKIAIAFTLMICNCACKKFVSIDAPVNQITAQSTFSNDATANAAIVGIYSRLSASSLIQSTTPYSGMYADEVVNFASGPQTEFSESALTLASSPVLNGSFWSASYQFIYPANLAIEALNENTSIGTSLRLQLIGEAKFIRAYLYLNLTNFFGDVPLILGSPYQQSSIAPRSARAEVLKQVIQDLDEAVFLLPDVIEAEKIRANKWAALALLSRACLYAGQYTRADELATQIISSNKFNLVPDPGKIFLKNSSESILQLYPTQANQNTPDGLSFLPATSSETPKYYLTADLLDQFEQGDMRRSIWVGSRQFSGKTYHYPAKYKILNTGILSEYLVLMRLGEQYLIRAEARIKLGEVSSGIADLNALRKRARAISTPVLSNPLPDLPLDINQPNALMAVEKERRIELMCENGHRFMDLQRTGRANQVLATLKPNSWKPWAVLWPIPDEQLRANPFLNQNAGYN